MARKQPMDAPSSNATSAFCQGFSTNGMAMFITDGLLYIWLGEEGLIMMRACCRRAFYEGLHEEHVCTKNQLAPAIGVFKQTKLTTIGAS